MNAFTSVVRDAEVARTRLGGPAGAVEAADGDAEVSLRHGAGRLPAAVVAGIREVDAALGIALRRHPHVIAAGRRRQGDGAAPAVAEERRGVRVPAALRSPSRPHADGGRCDDGTPATCGLRCRLAGTATRCKSAVSAGRACEQIGFRLLPFALDQAGEAQAAIVIQTCAGVLSHLMAGVLAPLRAGFVPGHPQPAGAIAGQAWMCLEQGERSGQTMSPNFGDGAAGQTADADAVIAGLVAVPADPDAILLGSAATTGFQSLALAVLTRIGSCQPSPSTQRAKMSDWPSRKPCQTSQARPRCRWSCGARCPGRRRRSDESRCRVCRPGRAGANRSQLWPRWLDQTIQRLSPCVLATATRK